MSSLPNNIKLKIGCDGVSDLKFHPEQDTLVIGTVGGRVRIYDCTYDEPQELFRKRWHENLTRISISKSGAQIMTSSSQGGIKHHDFSTGSGTWKSLKAHDESVSALVWQTENLFISGDESGLIKVWDVRQEACVSTINACSDEDKDDMEYLGAINDLVVDSNGRHLFAALDDGNLVTINLRKRAVELCSESLSYSAKSIQTFKDQTKLAVATDEGVVTIFNWNEFGNLSDRFPVSSIDDPIERMVKVNENVMAMSTASGRIKAASLLPNLVLSDIGKHSFAKGDDNCGDCMTLAINGDSSFIVSGCPESDVVCFYSPDIIIKESMLERNDRSKNKRKKERAVTKDRNKRKRMENNGFLDGMISDNEEDCTGKSDSENDSSDDSDD